MTDTHNTAWAHEGAIRYCNYALEKVSVGFLHHVVPTEIEGVWEGGLYATSPNAALDAYREHGFEIVSLDIKINQNDIPYNAVRFRLPYDHPRKPSLQAQYNMLSKENERLKAALEAVRDYAFNPEAQSVNAGDMTVEERLAGAGLQAEEALDVSEQARDVLKELEAKAGE